MAGWNILLPVKQLLLAKSRMVPLDAALRQELALAFALDTVELLLSVPDVAHVHVLTADLSVQAGLAGIEPVGDRSARIQLIPEPDQYALNPALHGLNPALRGGLTEIRRRSFAGPVAILTADLPAARPAELAEALSAARAQQRAVLLDADGEGTVLLAANSAALLAPQFGPDSGARHIAQGHLPLDGDWPGLRRDVDSVPMLASAAALGLRPRSQSVVRSGEFRRQIAACGFSMFDGVAGKLG